MPNSVIVVEKVSLIQYADLQIQLDQNSISSNSVRKYATILYEKCKDLPSTVSLLISSLFNTYTIEIEFSIHPEIKSATRLFYYQKQSHNEGLFQSTDNYSESIVEFMGFFHSEHSPSTTFYSTLASRLWNETKVFVEIQILDECNASFFGHSWTVLQNDSLEKSGLSNFEETFSNSPIVQSLRPLKARRSSSFSLDFADHSIPSESQKLYTSSSHELDDSFVDIYTSPSDQNFNNIESGVDASNCSNEAFDSETCLTTNSPSLPITTDILNQVGTWLYSTKLGQIVSRSRNAILSPDRSRKWNFALDEIWLLGTKYDLKASMKNSSVSTYRRRCEYYSFFRKAMLPRDSFFACQNVLLLADQPNTSIILLLSSWFKNCHPAWEVVSLSQTSLEVKLWTSAVNCDSYFSKYAKTANRYWLYFKFTAQTLKYEVGDRTLLDCIFIADKNISNCSNRIRESSQDYMIELSILRATCHECLAFIIAQSLKMRLNSEDFNSKNTTELVFCDSYAREPYPSSFNLAPKVPNYRQTQYCRSEDTELTNIPKIIIYHGTAIVWSYIICDWIYVSIEIDKQNRTLFLRTLLDKFSEFSFKIEKCKVATLEFETMALVICRDVGYPHCVLPLVSAYARSFSEIFYELGGLKVDYEEIENDYYFKSFNFTSKASPSSCNHGHETMLEITGVLQSHFPDSNELLLQEFAQDFHSRFWFTYRKDMPRIAPTFLTTDLGWGCMLRCGQSLIAEAFSRLYFGRDWRLYCIGSDSDNIRDYMSIISLFEDHPNSVYSIHRMATFGAQYGVPIGEQFTPSSLTRVLKIICKYHAGSPFSISEIHNGIFNVSKLSLELIQKPLVLLCPIRLGIEKINNIYKTFVLRCLELKQTLGLIGGKPGRSFYIVGYQIPNELLYLDPHVLKTKEQHIDESIRTLQYHTLSICAMQFSELDPSLLLGFIVKGEADLLDLLAHLRKAQESAPILSFN